MTDATESRARALADADYRRRVAVIAESQGTAEPISMSGPYSGLEYLLSAAQWDAAPADDFVKDYYRKRVRRHD